MSEASIVRDGRTGEAVVAGKDVTVPEILVALATDDGMARAVEAIPSLSREDVIAAVNFAIDASRTVDITAATYHPDPPDHGDSIASLDERIQDLSYELDLLKGIREGLEDLAAGRGIPHEQVMAELRAMLPD